jgi:hypothetical protein
MHFSFLNITIMIKKTGKLVRSRSSAVAPPLQKNIHSFLLQMDAFASRTYLDVSYSREREKKEIRISMNTF